MLKIRDLEKNTADRFFSLWNFVILMLTFGFLFAIVTVQTNPYSKTLKHLIKMKTDQIPTIRSNKRFYGILIGTTLLLAIPLLLQTTIGTGIDGQGFNWKVNDFVIFGILLFSAGLLVELVLRKVKSRKNRWLLGAGVLILLFLVWADLAVGIFNIPGFSGS